MALWLRLSLALLLLTTLAEAAPETRTEFAAKICAQVETESAANGLDAAFFARLLWRESLFDPNVTSNKGAQGIAQFMPGTAAKRGLADPYAPEAAVKAAAAYLADLIKQFGNKGLAAAAYNAGEARIMRWLDGKSQLPAETEAYVSFITGHDAESWKTPTAEFAAPALGVAKSFAENCVALAVHKQRLEDVHIASAPPTPWGALLVVNFNEATAMAQFQRLKLRFPAILANHAPLIQRKRNLSRGTRALVYIMLGETSRDNAVQTCAGLNAAGAPCIVRKN